MKIKLFIKLQLFFSLSSLSELFNQRRKSLIFLAISTHKRAKSLDIRKGVIFGSKIKLAATEERKKTFLFTFCHSRSRRRRCLAHIAVLSSHLTGNQVTSALSHFS